MGVLALFALRQPNKWTIYIRFFLKLIKFKFILILTLTKLNDILNIVKGGECMAIEVIPDWLAGLDEEDVSFIKKFLLASGSLKEIAGQYNVTYPTVRLRLDKLIQKIKIAEENSNEPYISLIKKLAIDDKLDFDTAKLLIGEYKKARDSIKRGIGDV